MKEQKKKRSRTDKIVFRTVQARRRTSEPFLILILMNFTTKVKRFSRGNKKKSDGERDREGDAVIERPWARDFVVGRCFDTNDGRWAQGEYGYKTRQKVNNRAKYLSRGKK